MVGKADKRAEVPSDESSIKDESVVEKIQQLYKQGDLEAAKNIFHYRLYNKYYNDVVAILWTKVPADQVEDISFSVFLSLWEAIVKGKKIDNFYAYLRAILNYKIADFYEDKYRIRQLNPGVDLSSLRKSRKSEEDALDSLDDWQEAALKRLSLISLNAPVEGGGDDLDAFIGNLSPEDLDLLGSNVSYQRSPEEELENREFWDLIRKKLAELPWRWQVAFESRIFENMTNQEVAERFAREYNERVTENAVKKYYSRACSRLEEILPASAKEYLKELASKE
ncbi:MAG: RNA polymerase sigma factor [bacterium]